MKCKAVQEAIPEYINGTITDNKLEKLLVHIASCNECYEELEITYTIKAALQQLDENPDVSFDINSMLKKELKNANTYIKRRKTLHSFMAGIYATAELGLLLLTIIQLCVWFTNGLWVF